jgi:GYF domain 2
MAVEWYFQDLRGQHGPLGTSELRKKLGSYTNLDNVLIWREGFEDWKPVAEVFDFFAPSALDHRRRAKRRWALYGLTLGILLCAADIVFEWRGKQYLSWAGNEAENIGRAFASVGIPTFLFFLAGTIRDAFFSRRKIGSKLTAVAGETLEQNVPRTPTAQRYNFIAKNWRGEYPLVVSYWVFGLIGNLAVPLIALGLAAVFEAKTNFQPAYVFAFILSVWVISIGISIWLWVGVWRSANRYIDCKSLELERAPWAGVAKLMAVVAFIQLAAAVIAYGIPQVTEASRVAFMDDPDIPKYFIRVMRGGTEAEITGGIKYGLADDFKKILRASRQIRVVHLNSIGGRIGEAEKLYSLIRDGRLNTSVSAKCMSACTLVFSGGVERVLLRGAVLGFHRGSFAGEDEEDSPELRGQRKIFTEAGYEAPFIAHALATPSSNMWKPSEAELLKSRVITRISNGSDYAFSGLPAEASKEWFSKSLKQSAGVYAAMDARFTKAYDEMVSAYYDAFRYRKD